MPEKSRQTFDSQALTSLYLSQSSDGVNKAAKALRNGFRYGTASGMSTSDHPPGSRVLLPQVRLDSDWTLEEVEQYQPVTVNLFDSVPRGLEKILQHLTVSIPQKELTLSQQEYLDSRKRESTPRQVLATKKYKPVALKVKPHLGTLPEEFRIIRNIVGDPLEGMLELNPNPPSFTPTGRYTEERREQVQRDHVGDFLWPQERNLIDDLMCKQNQGFAWEETEKGRF